MKHASALSRLIPATEKVQSTSTNLFTVPASRWICHSAIWAPWTWWDSPRRGGNRPQPMVDHSPMGTGNAPGDSTGQPRACGMALPLTHRPTLFLCPLHIRIKATRYFTWQPKNYRTERTN